MMDKIAYLGRSTDDVFVAKIHYEQGKEWSSMPATDTALRNKKKTDNINTYYHILVLYLCPKHYSI